MDDKERLRLAKEALGSGSYDKETIEYIFPELKESDDERIRKIISDILLIDNDEMREILDANNVLMQDIDAWLEKQGEKDKLIKELGEYKIKYTQEVLEKHLNSMNNKDDERLRKTTISFLKDFADKGYENAVECIDWLEKQGKEEYALKSFKDEDVRKFMQCIVKQAKAYEFNLPNRGYDIYAFAKDLLVWLEKQGEQKPVLEMKTPEESLGIDSETYSKIVDECIYGEQKPTDKVESKFKAGDWAVSDLDKTTRYISEVHNDKYNNYYVIKGDVETECDIYEYDRLHHLWTIQDAKDGDVLVGSYGTFIFMGKSNGGYCGVLSNNTFIRSTGNNEWTEDLHPATKEQRDILMKAMDDAGYEFDFDKKELKKIEQNTAWSEEDEKMYRGLHNLIYSTPYCDSRKELSDWLKSFKDRVQSQPQQEWSEEDYGMLNELLNYCDHSIAYNGKGTLQANVWGKRKDWLESLKDKVQQQPKQEWSKEDEVKLYKALSYIKDDALKEFINSLKYHKRWKPSDKQINALSDVLSLRDIKTDVLSELLKCLRKLK
jgi:hypothetical protein